MPANTLTAPITISTLAGLDASQSGFTAEDRKKLEATLRDAAHTFAALKPYDVGPTLLSSLTNALKQPLADVLGEVWKQRKELRVAAQAKAPASVSKADVALIDHTLTSTLKPSVTITVKVGGLPPAPIKMEFDVDVSLTLKGLEITIENAKVTKLRAGEIKSSVRIKWENQELWKPFEKTIDLKKEVILKDGGIAL
ncbi:MAG TPA: hypothetical protein VGQ56_16415 [Gemmatimonadaceae bacterium]|jgi:hypothetical protein|nr:hypothetical protein [Gemmatimonadaceae bacterium]